MFRSYFLSAIRNLTKHKMYTLINVLGLAIGLTSFILIGFYVAHELSYDRFHKNADRIARVTMEYSMGGTMEKAATTGTKVGPQFSRSFPSVEAFTRTFMFPRVLSYGEKTFNEKAILYADSGFLRMFSFPLTEGDPSSALRLPDQVLVSASMAKKYFGQDDPMGKVLHASNTRDLTVTGVFADVPSNSQMHFDFIASFSSLDASHQEEWWTANYVTYLLLHQADQLEPLQKQVTAYMNLPETRRQAEVQGSDYLTYQLQALKKVHLYSALAGWEPNGNITYIYILGAIAALILTIACVNYTNLATAQAATRSGEIAIRQVLGARPGQLFRQYLGESLLVTWIAMLVALGLCVVLMPLFDRLSDKTFSASALFGPYPLTGMALLVFLVSLLAGGYPAFILSQKKIHSILKSGFSLSGSGQGLRKSLIVLQFVISIFLIISTMVILQQLHFIQHAKLGYEKDHVLVLPVDRRMHAGYENIKQAFARAPGVTEVGGANQSPVFVEWTDGLEAQNGGQKKSMSIKCIPADLDFIHTLGMQIVAGQDFIRSDFFRMDTTDNYKNYRLTVILNESAVKALGWKPGEAIGRTVTKGALGVVKGVVKDFHFASMHEPIGPLCIFLDTQWVNQLFVRISGRNLPATLRGLQTVWKQRVPYRPFEYRFLDDDFNALYKAEARTAQLFSAFSVTAILLACLGLFALAAFVTVQRTKEIGVRKVLGASLFNITGLLTGDFLKLVALAALIAFPLAWWASHKWLEDFAYRIHVSWWIFAVAALLALLIALAAVGWQAIRAALASPVKSLRTE
jgi:putative ABC transport system permease protein